MSKVVSDQQRLANRQNAQRSTGPTTDAGKARVAENPLKHGLLAKDVVIRSTQNAESQTDFDALLADLCDELQPQGLVEETLVERIAACYWRLRRAHRFEAGTIQNALAAINPNDQLVHACRADVESLRKLLAYERETAELLEKPTDQLSPDEADAAAQQTKTLVKHYKLADSDVPVEDMMERLREALPEILRNREVELEDFRGRLHAAEDANARRCERKALLASLPETESLYKVIRYENMLDRQLHRAFAELRRRRTTVEGHPNKNKICKTNPFDARTEQHEAEPT